MRAAEGRVIVCKSVVTIDYDLSEELSAYVDIFIKYIEYRAYKLGSTSVYCRPSPSKQGIHCTVCFPHDMDELERLAVEAALLDDPVRIYYNLKRLLRTGKLHDILFVLKDRLRREVI